MQPSVQLTFSESNEVDVCRRVTSVSSAVGDIALPAKEKGRSSASFVLDLCLLVRPPATLIDSSAVSRGASTRHAPIRRASSPWPRRVLARFKCRKRVMSDRAGAMAANRSLPSALTAQERLSRNKGRPKRARPERSSRDSDGVLNSTSASNPSSSYSSEQSVSTSVLSGLGRARLRRNLTTTSRRSPCCCAAPQPNGEVVDRPSQCWTNRSRAPSRDKSRRACVQNESICREVMSSQRLKISSFCETDLRLKQDFRLCHKLYM